MKSRLIVRGQDALPSKLYKYYGNISHAIDMVESGEMFFSKSMDFNDIFDCEIINNGEILDIDAPGELPVIISLIDTILLECSDFFITFFQKGKDYEKMRLEFANTVSSNRVQPSDYLKFVHRYSEWHEDYPRFYKRIKTSFVEKHHILSLSRRVACFCEMKDSILMWSYYADNHRGVCLEFDFSVLNDNMDKEQKYPFLAGKVQYSKALHNDPAKFTSADSLDESFFTKAFCWEHEKEWRIVLSNDDERLKFPCLTGIYLGARFREKYSHSLGKEFERLIAPAASFQSKVGVYEAIPDNKEYKINFTQIIPPDKER